MNGLLVGVVGVRRKTHLFTLFVADGMQRRGLGRLLWNHVKAHVVERVKVEEFTVNSATNAVPIYERLGFKVAGPVVNSQGIMYLPMRLRSF